MWVWLGSVALGHPGQTVTRLRQAETGHTELIYPCLRRRASSSRLGRTRQLATALLGPTPEPPHAELLLIERQGFTIWSSTPATERG